MANTDSLATNQEYAFDYFSGSQISIYIKDIWISDIEAIQFTVSQSKRPIYGYHSQYYHRLAAGQVLVEGTFSINFKDAYYLTSTLLTSKEESADHKKFGFPGWRQYKQQERMRISRDGLNWQERNAQDVIKEMITKNQESGQTSSASVDNLKLALLQMDDQQFIEAKTELENVLFNTSLEDGFSENLNDTSWAAIDPLSRTKDLMRYRRADQYPPFDICIIYGDFAASHGHTTSKKIVQASIMGQGQTIVANGEPIKEIFSFIGRNLI